MKTHVSTVDFAAENFDFFAGQNIITRSAATKVLVLLVYDPSASKKERYKMVQTPKRDGPPVPANLSCKPLWLSRCSVGFLAVHSAGMRVCLEPGQHGTASFPLVSKSIDY